MVGLPNGMGGGPRLIRLSSTAGGEPAIGDVGAFEKYDILAAFGDVGERGPSDLIGELGVIGIGGGAARIGNSR